MRRSWPKHFLKVIVIDPKITLLCHLSQFVFFKAFPSVHLGAPWMSCSNVWSICPLKCPSVPLSVLPLPTAILLCSCNLQVEYAIMTLQIFFLVIIKCDKWELVHLN